MRFFTFEPTDRPRWFELRRRFARWLVNIAKRIYPQSPEVFAFLQEVMLEEVLYGSGVVKMPGVIAQEKKTQ